jgi:hypothetical protein
MKTTVYLFFHGHLLSSDWSGPVYTGMEAADEEEEDGLEAAPTEDDVDDDLAEINDEVGMKVTTTLHM